jgi:hypothetical protein
MPPRRVPLAVALTLTLTMTGGSVLAAPAAHVLNQMTTTTRCASKARAVFAASRGVIQRWVRTAWLGRQAGLTATVSDNLAYDCRVQMTEIDLASRMSPRRLTRKQDALVLASLAHLLTVLHAKPGQFVNVTLWPAGGRTMSCIGLALAPTPAGEYARLLAGSDCQPVAQIRVLGKSEAALVRAERVAERDANAVHSVWAH